MIKRSKQINKEIAAAYLEDGNVVVFHDGESKEKSCWFYPTGGTKGNYTYHGIRITGFVHTHPYVNPNDSSNPLCMSIADFNTIEEYGYYDVNILTLDGNYYQQGISGNSRYSPNLKYNINSQPY